MKQGVLILVSFILLGVSPAAAQTVFPLQPQLQPTGEFDLSLRLRTKGIVAGTIRQMLAKDQSLFFLIQIGPPVNPETFLVRSDLSGNLQYVTSLGLIDVSDWAVGAGLEIIVDAEPSAGGLPELLRYDVNGNLATRTARPRALYGAAASLESPLKLTRSGGVVDAAVRRRVADRPGLIKHLSPFDTRVLPIPNHKIAIIDNIDADMTVVDLRNGASVVHPLDHPEVTRVKHNYFNSENARGLTVLSSAASQDGEIYCILTGFRPEEGAPVLVVDAGGRTKKLFRLRLGRDVDGRYVLPTTMAVTAGAVFVANGLGGVWSFSLDPLQ